MRHLVLGTAGHIDHGKTALIRALTGQDTDRLPEEKRRGITIDLGFAHLQLARCEYAVVDVPGHESLVRNMLAGASGMDVVLLVVAADEGVMPQTREHLAIMRQLAVREVVVAITKCDLVTPDWLELVTEDIRTELQRFGTRAPLIPVSAVSGEGLPRLREELAAAADSCPLRPAEDLFRLPVDRVFTVRGTGTVVTGTIWSGQVGRDALLRALPEDIPVRVRGLQRHGKSADQARAGERVALAVALPRTALQRGSTLVDHEAWRTTTIITVELDLLPDAAPIKNRTRVRLHLGTREVMARVNCYGEELKPGETGWGQLRLEGPVVSRAGDRFVLRSYSPVRTIGGGAVAEPVAPRRKRLTSETVGLLEKMLRGGDPITAAVRLADGGGVATEALPVLTGATPTSLRPPFPQGVYPAGDQLFPAALALALGNRLEKALAAYHLDHPLAVGMSREELRRAAPEVPSQLVDRVLSDLARDAIVKAAGASYALAQFRPEPTASQQHLSETLLRLLSEAGRTPPWFSELPPEIRDHPDLEAVAQHLVRQGAAIALAHDHLADPAAIATARSALATSFGEQARQSASRLKEVLGVTRKHLIPLLEYFDRIGVTSRDGDERVAGPKLGSGSGEGG